MDFLKDIQNRPENERKKIMRFFVLICGVFIFFTWLALLPRIIKKNKLEKPDVLKQTIAQADSSISKYNFAGLKETFKRAFDQKNLKQENIDESEKIIETERLPIESQEQENKITQEQDNE